MFISEKMTVIHYFGRMCKFCRPLPSTSSTARMITFCRDYAPATSEQFYVENTYGVDTTEGTVHYLGKGTYHGGSVFESMFCV